MRILVFGGSAAIGHAVAWDVPQDHEVKGTGILGTREEAPE